MTDPNAWNRDKEDFGQWSDRMRIQREQWERANPGLSAPIHPPTPAFSGEPPRQPIVLGTYEPSAEARESFEGNTSFLVLFPALAGIVAWPILYALPVGAAIVATGVVYGVLEYGFGVVDEGARRWLTALAVVVGLILLFPLSRLDHRLARSWLWRGPRHLVRLALFTGVVHLAVTARFAPAELDVWRPVPGGSLLGRPLYLFVLAVVAVLVHVVLTRPGFRAWWHRGLEAIGLRPRMPEKAGGS
jgi:hypothetical protein